ncbi:MAG: LL-diaminopimelate aminotransferase [Deltaproteobacteria bacterium]|nr:MAG: LL-diaminopimelate aminotransferase [Deltaproteobacteria bacterium]
MTLINANYLKLKSSYLFADIARRIQTFQAANPEKNIIKLGIGDVTRPLPPACIEAFHQAVDEMAREADFRGYGPEQGYAFLREAIAQNDFNARGADIDPDEIFISDGAKCDTGNIQEIFSTDARIAIPDPVYPVYVDTNVMAGRTGDAAGSRYDGIVYMDATAENKFIPSLPTTPVDLIYLCFPNNPTGSTISREQLKTWVEFARDQKAIILYDAAYEAFIRNPDTPRSIYEIDGAKAVAIEFRSFSKTAGFTGTRCAFTVVPKTLMAYDVSGNAHPVHNLWSRRHSTKFNGVSYPVQRAAAAVYTDAGNAQVNALIDGYMENAAIIRNAMTDLGYDLVGGDNSPYIWINGKTDSWEFFDRLLNEAGVVCTPGAGFGSCGQTYIRISAFNSRENVEAAMDRIKTALAG